MLKQAGCVMLLKLRALKVQGVKLLWGLKFSRLEYYNIFQYVWCGQVIEQSLTTWYCLFWMV
jgi:hypothetical protein